MNEDLMSFKGFPEEAFRFFRNIKRNNKREWFLENKDVYEENVVEPARELAQSLATSSLAKKVGLHSKIRNPLFRIYRDVRFSNDKSPYKSHGAMEWTRSGGRGDTGMLYLHIDPKESFVAAGFYMPDAALLRRFRLAAVEEPVLFKKLNAAMKKSKLNMFGEDALKRMPRGFETYVGHEAEEFLKLKHLVVSRQLSIKKMQSASLSREIEKFAQEALPMLKWGWRHLDSWRREGGDPAFQEALNKRS